VGNWQTPQRLLSQFFPTRDRFLPNTIHSSSRLPSICRGCPISSLQRCAWTPSSRRSLPPPSGAIFGLAGIPPIVFAPQDFAVLGLAIPGQSPVNLASSRSVQPQHHPKGGYSRTPLSSLFPTTASMSQAKLLKASRDKFDLCAFTIALPRLGFPCSESHCWRLSPQQTQNAAETRSGKHFSTTRSFLNSEFRNANSSAWNPLRRLGVPPFHGSSCSQSF
jgi:hypothetical protein